MLVQRKKWPCVLLLATLASGLTTAVSARENVSPATFAATNSLHLKTMITEAISAFENTERNSWSHYIDRYENEEGDISSSTEHYDAGQPAGQRWTLLTLNGKQPSDKAQRKYQQKRQKQREKNSENQEQSFSISLQELIQTATLTLNSEDTHFVYANFKVSLPRIGEDASKHLTGLLSYNKQHQFIESIEISNTAPFSPMFSAEITELTIQFNFQKIDSAVLPLSNQMTMKGSWAFFTEINEVSKDTYRDFNRISDTEQNPQAK
ncbi:hypothetical protein [Planctobacterium marinum]|uniref:hypothetical protein n=1 Tax=Planctobacterium marinum TaxID=1631968 RepID=UPI001E372560|nr:hypothetical protein [Planctobacterium marinum]MCC2605676.1 hypothetical protein [Planctobacterium marinum]